MEPRGNSLQIEAGGRPLFFRAGAVLALTALLTLLCAGGAWAQTFTVTNTNDSGAGSLRAAIKGANYAADADQIAFADGVGGTITLSSALPKVTDPEGLVIDGGGDVTVSGNQAVGVFWVNPGAELELRNLTVADGERPRDQEFPYDHIGGGGIHNEGTLQVANGTFSANHAPSGGGIYNSGTLEVTDSVFDGNFADYGGAINFGGGTLTVQNSTFFANSASSSGGAIEKRSGTAEVRYSTFLGNRAEGMGDGQYGGAIHNYSGAATMRGTIVANSGSHHDCDMMEEGITDGGYNVSDDGSCGFSQANGSLPNTDPLLDPEGLRDNGGPTKTIALRPESPAVDLVAPGTCPPPETDQRGVQRPQGAACDTGAFELEQQAEPTDTTAPGVDATSPAKGQTGVARATNVMVTFSEQMDPASITKAAFRLFRVSSDGTTTRITAAPVTLSADGLRATLDPYGASSTRLASGGRYKALVTTGAKDMAGNALDQNLSKLGNQQKAWTFTTG